MREFYMPLTAIRKRKCFTEKPNRVSKMCVLFGKVHSA